MIKRHLLLIIESVYSSGKLASDERLSLYDSMLTNDSFQESTC